MNRRLLTIGVVLLLLAACDDRKNELLPAYCPIPIKKEMPVYPDILKRASPSATVELSALVDENGNVTEIQIVKSVPVVDSICISAARHWKFTPGRLADNTGKYVNAKFWFPIFFDWSI